MEADTSQMWQHASGRDFAHPEQAASSGPDPHPHALFLQMSEGRNVHSYAHCRASGQQMRCEVLFRQKQLRNG